MCLLQQVAAALLTSSVAAASAAPMHHPTYPASCPDLMILPASLTLGCRPGARTERASWQVHCGLHVRRRPERSHLLPRAEQTVENPPTLSGGTMRSLLCARGAPLCVRTLPSAHGQLQLLLIPCASALAAFCTRPAAAAANSVRLRTRCFASPASLLSGQCDPRQPFGCLSPGPGRDDRLRCGF